MNVLELPERLHNCFFRGLYLLNLKNLILKIILIFQEETLIIFHFSLIIKYHLQGYRAVWYGKTEHNENPNKYSKGDTNFVLSFIMIKPYKPQPNVDGMKPIAQAIPQVQQPQAIKPEESFDDDLPPF